MHPNPAHVPPPSHIQQLPPYSQGNIVQPHPHQSPMPPTTGAAAVVTSGLTQSTQQPFMPPHSSHLPPQPAVVDPLQSLKDVKVPGYVPSSSQASERPPSGSTMEVKKEPDFGVPMTSRASPAHVGDKCSTPKNTTPTPHSQVSQTPPLRVCGEFFRFFGNWERFFNNFLFAGTNSPHSAINLINSGGNPPVSLPQSMQPHPGAPYPPQHSHPLMHPSFLHPMHPFHSHPYSPYPFSYPYPYPVPQPHAIPPPSGRVDGVPQKIDTMSATLMSSQHSTTSTLTSKKEIREPIENGELRYLPFTASPVDFVVFHHRRMSE